MFDLSASIVMYKNDPEQINAAISSFLNTSLNVSIMLVDNSPTDVLKAVSNDERCTYFHNPANPGFGAGHNIAIKSFSQRSHFHLILNPDIYFDTNQSETILHFMKDHPYVGVVMPKVLYPDGSLQRIAKLLPSPFVFFARRFVPIKAIQNRVNSIFELHAYRYDKVIDVPFLSGCFLICRMDVLNNIGGFDEKIFMYTEDIDLCRRVIDTGYRTVLLPDAFVYHAHERKSFSSMKTLKVYLISALYYFNKWGWFFDRKRSAINAVTIRQINNEN